MRGVKHHTRSSAGRRGKLPAERFYMARWKVISLARRLSEQKVKEPEQRVAGGAGHRVVAVPENGWCLFYAVARCAARTGEGARPRSPADGCKFGRDYRWRDPVSQRVSCACRARAKPKRPQRTTCNGRDLWCLSKQ